VSRSGREPSSGFRDEYLVEPVDDPDNWCMGALSEGEIVCWGQYGPLERALRSL
jgi:hypothetical protein